MAVTFGFYNSVNGDRKYSSTEFGNIFDGIIQDGVFEHIGTALKVVASEGMTVNVGEGRSWFNKKWTYNDSPYPVTLSLSEPALNRIDTVILEINTNDAFRLNSFKFVKGSPASNPIPPNLTNTDTTHQYPLANIYVGAGVTEILPANITNLVGTEKCPFVKGELATLTIEGISALMEYEFNIWFETIKDVLDEETAGMLLNLINTKPDFEDVEAQVNDHQMASYMAWISNINTTALSAAFGEFNEDLIKGLGNQMAMYAWYKGDSKSLYPFIELKKKQTLKDISISPAVCREINLNANLITLISSHPFPIHVMRNSIPTPGSVLYVLPGPTSSQDRANTIRILPTKTGMFTFYMFGMASNNSASNNGGTANGSITRVKDGSAIWSGNLTGTSRASTSYYTITTPYLITQDDIDGGGFNLNTGGSSPVSEMSVSGYIASSKDMIINEPVKAGDLCVVQGPYQGLSSPNYQTLDVTWEAFTFPVNFTGSYNIIYYVCGLDPSARTLTVTIYVNDVIINTAAHSSRNNEQNKVSNVSLIKNDVIRVTIRRTGPRGSGIYQSQEGCGITNFCLTADAPENLLFVMDDFD